jgi:general nucleoside transport system permease protein
MPWNLMLKEAFLIALFAATIRLAMPVLLAALGEIIAELSGVMNLGLEGIMAIGGFTGFAVASVTGNIWIGLLAALLAGTLMGALMAFLSVTLQLDQVVTGIILVLFGVSLSNFLYRQAFGMSGSPPRIDPLPNVPIPILSEIPYIGPVLFNQNIVVYLTVVLVAILWFVIKRTTWGLNLRATGDVPSAVDTAGISVSAVRYIATMFGSALAGLGGAFLTAGQLGLFLEDIMAGRGWVALALVIFARWHPGLAVVGALIFGFTDAVQFRLQALGSASTPYEVFIALPYVITIIALFAASKRSAEPTALGIPYVKGQR